MIDEEYLDRWAEMAQALVVPEQTLFLRVFAMLAMEHEREICALMADARGQSELAALIRRRGQQ